MSRSFWIIVGTAAVLLAGTASDAAEPPGVIVHAIESEHQAGPTEIRVLLPNSYAERTTDAPLLRVVYFLPVEAGRSTRYGDPLAEAVRIDAANRFIIVCVQPTFAALPWYADHPTDPKLAQETYFLKVVVPFVEKTYAVGRTPGDRLLLGFSKSGWGAWSLLLRHPEVFGRAASWDAPLEMTWPTKYGSQPIFATEENFERYRITKSLERRAELLRGSNFGSEEDREARPRLILLGRGNFQDDQAIHGRLNKLNVPHIYHAGPKREHLWSSGWVGEALVELTKTK